MLYEVITKTRSLRYITEKVYRHRAACSISASRWGLSKSPVHGSRIRIRALGRARTTRGCSVITSYSIHYTKLYECSYFVVLFCGGRFICPSICPMMLTTCKGDCASGAPYSLISAPSFLQAVFSRVCRITSYNVCYTKLLRDRGAYKSAAAEQDDEI